MEARTSAMARDGAATHGSRRHVTTKSVGTALVTVFVGAGLLGGIKPAIAHANICEHRTAAHVVEHGGIDADSAWHVAHGELPTCDDEADAAGQRDTNDHDDEGKSRYCRTHWFC